jgi:phosphoribosylanthranilate isomerase
MNMRQPKIKICCIASIEEAALAISAGAGALGLVSAMPSGPGVISETRIREIAESVPVHIATFLLTSSQDAAEIIEQQRRCGTNTVQIVDRLVRGSLADLRRALPGVSLVQVIHVEDERALIEPAEAASCVDALLLDSGRPSAAVKELGGTGRVHDWALSRRIREAVSVPVYLAGGLRADNVGAAIAQVRPFGVDICSGVRTGGALDEAKLREFVQAVRAAGSGAS